MNVLDKIVTFHLHLCTASVLWFTSLKFYQFALCILTQRQQHGSDQQELKVACECWRHSSQCQADLTAEKSFFVCMQILKFSTRKFNKVGIKKKVGVTALHHSKLVKSNWSIWQNVLNYLWWNVLSQNWTYFFQITDLRKKFAVLKTLRNV